MKKLNKGKISSEEFDKRFDNGEDMGNHINTKKASVHKTAQRVNIDFPAMFLKKLDNEAKKIGIARTALIKMWLADKLEHLAH